MASIASVSSSHTSGNARSGILHEVRAFWHQFVVKAFDPYRPELHYMRGPGPACAAKHIPSTHQHST